ncbi:L,D-transpeptidase family protein [soil metagenome]
MKKNVWLLSFLFILPSFVSAFDAYNPGTTSQYYLVIDKSDNTITLYDNVDWVLQWPCTFGSNDMGDKMVQGDRKTPDGSFHILTKTTHAKWHKMMKLDYPTEADRQKFNERKAKGIIPANAKIGGDIAIHGTWPREEFAVEYLQNWTLGCISMRNDHLDELYNMISIGTQVIIRK